MSRTQLQSLLDKRAKVWETYQGLLGRADEDGFRSEDAEALDQAEAEIDKLSKDIERLERAARMEGEFEVPGTPPDGEGGEGRGDDGPDAEYRQAFEQFVRGGAADLDADQRQLLARGRVDSREMRAQGVSSDSAGGYTVPPEFRQRLVETMELFTPIRPLAEVITTDSGANMPWPTNDDTGNEGAIVAENTQVTEQDLTFGQDEVGAFMYTSRIVRVSFQILQDSFLNLDSFLGRKLGERIGRVHSRHFTVGSGDGQPQGVVTGAGVGVEDASTTLGWEMLVDLEHSVDAAYREGGDPRYMFSDATLATLRKEKDGQDRPIWTPSVQAGAPSTINGRPYTVNNYMAGAGAGNRSVLFGDIRSGYLIRDVRDIALLRLSERYADYLQVGFLAFARADGVVQDANAVKVIEHASGG